MAGAHPIVDCDSHVMESAEIWDCLEDDYQHRRPQIVNLAGTPGVPELDASWLIDGHLFPRPVGHGATIYGTPVTSSFARRKQYDPASQTLADGEARIRDLERFGVDIQVNFPSMMINEVLTNDLQFEAALMRAYNTSIASRVSKHRDRLKWVAVLPLRLPSEAVAEVRRVHELGAICATVVGPPENMMLHDPTLDCVWAECERLNLPVAIHITFHQPGVQMSCDSIYASNVIGCTVPVFLSFFSFVGGGVFDRHPGLRVGFFESGADWVPYLIQRMNHYYDAGKRFPWYGLPKQRPSEYLRRGHVYVACEGEEHLLPQVIDHLGADHVLVGTDMPHAEDKEHAVEQILSREDISDAVRHKILTENPLRFYGLSSTN